MKKILILLIAIFTFNIIAFAKEETIYPKPLVVTFSSKDCEECDLVELVKVQSQIEYKNTVDYVDIDFDDDDCDYVALKNRYNITKSPTTLFIGAQKGVTKKVSGYLPFKLYQKNVQSILPDVQE